MASSSADLRPQSAVVSRAQLVLGRRLLLLLALTTSCTTTARDSAPARSRVAPAQSRVAPAHTLGGSPVRFLSGDEASAFLSTPDNFTERLSAFDRGLRTKRVDVVDDTAYRAFLARQGLDFTPEERAAIGGLVDDVDRALVGLDLGLPPEVLFVKTTGNDELGAAYTRGPAIIFPARVAAQPSVGLIAHELFHVSSRAKPARRDARYALLGFRPIPSVELPAAVEDRRITNPDAFSLDHAVDVRAQNGIHTVVPYIVSALPLPQLIATERWFDALRVMFVDVDPRTGAPRTGEMEARVGLTLEDTDYLSRLSKNTTYAIHPEEALADNFALLVRRRVGEKPKLTNPDTVDSLETLLHSEH